VPGEGDLTLEQVEMMVETLLPMTPEERIRFLMGNGTTREKAEAISSIIAQMGSANPFGKRDSATSSSQPAAKPSDPDQFQFPF
jgi:hypothetical protein